jgi:hypothetical protein
MGGMMPTAHSEASETIVPKTDEPENRGTKKL